MLQLFLLYLGQLIALLLVALAWQLLQAPQAKPSSKPSGSESDVLTYESFLTAAKRLQEMSLYVGSEQGPNSYNFFTPPPSETPPTMWEQAREEYSRRSLQDLDRLIGEDAWEALFETQEE